MNCCHLLTINSCVQLLQETPQSFRCSEVTLLKQNKYLVVNEVIFGQTRVLQPTVFFYFESAVTKNALKSTVNIKTCIHLIRHTTTHLTNEDEIGHNTAWEDTVVPLVQEVSHIPCFRSLPFVQHKRAIERRLNNECLKHIIIITLQTVLRLWPEPRGEELSQRGKTECWRVGIRGVSGCQVCLFKRLHPTTRKYECTRTRTRLCTD